MESKIVYEDELIVITTDGWNTTVSLKGKSVEVCVVRQNNGFDVAPGRAAANMLIKDGHIAFRRYQSESA